MSEQRLDISKYAASARNFHNNAKLDLANDELRSNFRGAMDYLMDKRKSAFNDLKELETLRRQCKLIKQRCLLKLPYLLEQLELRGITKLLYGSNTTHTDHMAQLDENIECEIFDYYLADNKH